MLRVCFWGHAAAKNLRRKLGDYTDSLTYILTEPRVGKTRVREKLTLCGRYWAGASTGKSVVTRAKTPSASRTGTDRVIIQISPTPASK